jgi:hypothetical protein
MLPLFYLELSENTSQTLEIHPFSRKKTLADRGFSV